LEMDDWLAAEGVTHVTMESTGVYWKPIYNLLEGRFTVLLVNTKHVKHALDGRPTSRIVSGWRSCCNAGCSKVASFRRGPSGNCGN
jgi:transposase